MSQGVFCPACGEAQRPGARFCPACGRVAPPPAPAPIPAEAPRPGPPRGQVLGALALGAAVVLVAVALHGRGDSTEELPPGVTPAPTPLRLEARPFDNLGFTVSVPAGWASSRRTVETGRVAVLFRDPD